MDTKPVQKRLKFWGWGYEDEVVPESEREWMQSTWAKRFGVSSFTAVPTPKAEDIKLPAPRISVPSNLAHICTTDHYERVLHSYSKSFPDIIRVYARQCPAPVDVVALPRNASLVCQAQHCEGAYHHVHERSRDGQTGVPERAASAGGPRLRAARPLTPALPGNLLIARVQA